MEENLTLIKALEAKIASQQKELEALRAEVEANARAFNTIQEKADECMDLIRELEKAEVENKN